MAAPVGGHVGERLESMWNPVIDLLLVRVRLCIALTNALGDHAGITFGVAGVLAVFALHSRRVFEKVAAERTAHDVVELMLDELVPKDVVDFLFALSDGTFAS